MIKMFGKKSRSHETKLILLLYTNGLRKVKVDLSGKEALILHSQTGTLNRGFEKFRIILVFSIMSSVFLVTV